MINFSLKQLEIIKATGMILTTSGASGLTIKKLAQEMRFTEGAVYKHFASKEDIIIGLLEYLTESLDQHYTEAVSANNKPDANLLSLLQNEISFFNKNPHFVVAVFSDGLLEESKRINKTILNIIDVKTRHLLAIISEGQKTGVFTNLITKDRIIQIIMGTTRMQMFRWRVENFKSDLKQNGMNTIKSLLILIKKHNDE